MTSGQRKRWPRRVENQFTSAPPAATFDGEIAATFINHSTFLLQVGGVSVLTDPVYSRRASPVAWLGPKRVREPGLPFDKLPRIDVVLVSHNHYDHMDVPTLRRLQRAFAPLFITGLGNAATLRRHALGPAVELDWWQTHLWSDRLKITLTPAQHFSSRGLFDRDASLWGGFVLEAGRQRIHFVGDTGYAEFFRGFRERLGPIDLALIPIGAYEPRWFMQRAHANPAEAVQLHLDLDPRQSVAMHFGTFQLTDEGIDDPIHDLARALDERRVGRERFRVLDFGETLLLPPHAERCSPE